MANDVNDMLGIESSPKREQTPSPTKFCPSCGKQIDARAEMCPHCKASLVPSDKTANFSTKLSDVVGKSGIVFGAIASVGSIIGGLVCFGYDGVNIGTLPVALGLYMISKGLFMGTLVVLTAARK